MRSVIINIEDGDTAEPELLTACIIGSTSISYSLSEKSMRCTRDYLIQISSCFSLEHAEIWFLSRHLLPAQT